MSFPGFLSLRSVRRTAKPLLAAVAAALLASCGGGTSQIEAFVADRLIVFGDETSALTADGRRYAVNTVTDGVFDCSSQRIWVQALASIYDLAFAECNPDNVVTPQAFMRAAAGARVADVAAQVDAQLAGDGVAGNTLVTVLAGTNDVLDLYAAFPDTTRSELLSQARARGAQLAVEVNRLVAAGARVIVSTAPDVGLTPYALAEKAAYTDIDRAALLTTLTSEFNAGLRTTVLNDGRYVGLVLADEMVQAMTISPSSFGLANIKDAACAVALPDCTTATLVAGADAATWLWADDLRLAFNAQNRLGILAINRARNNPF
ncbi:SGNH/GDSL hydrolase family protein [Rubrivivax albus]|uniref:Esterase n=1 Tax=Rubrivivax albus TaxID=2499835 RepID=A0A3S2U903_9BURK|nr:SGNH/GDSL hydrolase family protein [Rubrivivax albus]RVT51599.1 esterase [Rubrivivax albus]